jgi:hypothetical protein
MKVLMSLAWISTAQNFANVPLTSVLLRDSFDSRISQHLLAKMVFG